MNNYVNNDSLCAFIHLLFTFFRSLLRSHEVSSVIFCVVEKTLNLLYPFSGAHMVLGRLRTGGKFKSHPYLLTFSL